MKPGLIGLGIMGTPMAMAAEVIFLMLPDTPDVQTVLFSEAGVASGLKDSAGAPTRAARKGGHGTPPP